MFNISKYREIKEFIQKNAKNCEIIAVSKNHPKESVVEAINNGVYIFGENRVMEAKTKFDDLKTRYSNIELHLTGPLQSNKVKTAAYLFDVFHTLDREKIALEFVKHKEIINKKKFFIQVNTGKEKNKSGLLPDEVLGFVNFCKKDLNLNIVGLMCIPPINEDPKLHFQYLKILANKNNLEQISIGMSNDYLSALDFNPNYVRLGTILFGSRNWAAI